jgi:hypothetical protein
MSPSKKSDNARLRLTILRNEYNDEIGTNIDRTLYEDIFEYITHDSKTKKKQCFFPVKFLNEFLFRSTDACLLPKKLQITKTNVQ